MGIIIYIILFKIEISLPRIILAPFANCQNSLCYKIKQKIKKTTGIAQTLYPEKKQNKKSHKKIITESEKFIACVKCVPLPSNLYLLKMLFDSFFVKLALMTLEENNFRDYRMMEADVDVVDDVVA